MDFEAGQRWHYHTREGEEQSTLGILRREVNNGRALLHIRIEGIILPNPRAENGIQTVLGHTPISAEALEKSVTFRAEQAFVPDDFSGYETWREAFIRQEAGVFTISVKEILDVVEQGLAAGLTKPKQDFNPVFLKINKANKELL
ncbi:hypothetical protein FNU79_08830 [Deinococcus detaillensis]|uniref:Uncharacterized protein n=1 Tax=Deinococcus detaillensis TaxID=2592048 RepID=A0A553V086_9DEIO|nr:hypothetical protein [Deinococcus detaillensis]TSA85877.1 hypothetical protein FNU79_08830 [Deinococcus detaillensis]